MSSIGKSDVPVSTFDPNLTENENDVTRDVSGTENVSGVTAGDVQRSAAAREILREISMDAIDTSVSSNRLDPSLGPCEMDTISMADVDPFAALTSAEMIIAAFSEALGGTNLAELSAEDLLAAFMVLNLTDKTKDTSTINDLNDTAKSAREMAIEAKKIQAEASALKSKEAADAAKEAQEAAEKASLFTKIFLPIIIIVAVVIAVVVTVCTAGAGAAALGATAAAAAGASSAGVAASAALSVTILGTTVAVKALVIGVLTGLGIGAAIGAAGSSIANYDATLSQLAAAEEAAESKKMGLSVEALQEFEDALQEVIESNMDLMQEIMQAMNKFLDMFKAMVDRKNSTAQDLLNATMSS